MICCPQPKGLFVSFHFQANSHITPQQTPSISIPCSDWVCLEPKVVWAQENAIPAHFPLTPVPVADISWMLGSCDF